jgi:hypothetical protein
LRPCQFRTGEPAQLAGSPGAEPGLAFGVTPHCLVHGSCLLRSERALESDAAGGLEARSDIDRLHGPSMQMPLHRRHRITAGTHQSRRSQRA